MVTGFFAGLALQFWFVARWMKRWERQRGVRLFTELWPLAKRPLADGPLPSRRRSPYYRVDTGTPAAALTEPPWEDLADPPRPIAILLGLYAASACAVAASGLAGESPLANAVRVVGGVGLVLLGVVMLTDRHGLRTLLAPARKGSGFFKVFAGALILAGVGAIVRGAVKLFESG